MSKQTVELLLDELDEAYHTLHDRLQGLTDEEFFWEPVPDCWTVRFIHNRWETDYMQPDPVPPPFTTIGWRLVHVALCKVMYYEYAFGPAKLTWDDIEVPHTAASSITVLEVGHAKLRGVLESMNDEDLTKMSLTNWGDSWPTWRIFWTMTFHDLNHGGEIACLRDLYRCQSGLVSL